MHCFFYDCITVLKLIPLLFLDPAVYHITVLPPKPKLLCALSYKRVGKHCNTGSCVRARVCVCARVCVPRTEVWVIQVLLKWIRGGSGFNSLPVRSPDFEKRWAIPLSACWSRFISLCLWENMRRQMPKAPSLLHQSVFTFTFWL